MSFRTTIIFLFITYLSVNGNYHHDSSEEDYDSEEDEDFINLEDYLPSNAVKGPDGQRECCPITRKDCTYLNITRNPDVEGFTSLVCVACARVNSSATMSWQGPNKTPIGKMTTVTSKNAVKIPLPNSTFFMKEIVVSNDENNGTEFACVLLESNSTVTRQLLRRYVLNV
ncbi:putative interleukin binding protein [Mudlarkpox virus]|nr:putative interleukin binding protein [Magpiepox virus]QRM15375.1 putative interleukin binding protein [Mudlarkpox virus]